MATLPDGEEETRLTSPCCAFSCFRHAWRVVVGKGRGGRRSREMRPQTAVTTNIGTETQAIERVATACRSSHQCQGETLLPEHGLPAGREELATVLNERNHLFQVLDPLATAAVLGYLDPAALAALRLASRRSHACTSNLDRRLIITDAQQLLRYSRAAPITIRDVVSRRVSEQIRAPDAVPEPAVVVVLGTEDEGPHVLLPLEASSAASCLRMAHGPLKSSGVGKSGGASGGHVSNGEGQGDKEIVYESCDITAAFEASVLTQTCDVQAAITASGTSTTTATVATSDNAAVAVLTDTAAPGATATIDASLLASSSSSCCVMPMPTAPFVPTTPTAPTRSPSSCVTLISGLLGSGASMSSETKTRDAATIPNPTMATAIGVTSPDPKARTGGGVSAASVTAAPNGSILAISTSGPFTNDNGSSGTSPARALSGPANFHLCAKNQGPRCVTTSSPDCAPEKGPPSRSWAGPRERATAATDTTAAATTDTLTMASIRDLPLQVASATAPTTAVRSADTMAAPHLGCYPAVLAACPPRVTLLAALYPSLEEVRIAPAVYDTRQKGGQRNYAAAPSAGTAPGSVHATAATATAAAIAAAAAAALSDPVRSGSPSHDTPLHGVAETGLEVMPASIQEKRMTPLAHAVAVEAADMMGFHAALQVFLASGALHGLPCLRLLDLSGWSTSSGGGGDVSGRRGRSGIRLDWREWTQLISGLPEGRDMVLRMPVRMLPAHTGLDAGATTSMSDSPKVPARPVPVAAAAGTVASLSGNSVRQLSRTVSVATLLNAGVGSQEAVAAAWQRGGSGAAAAAAAAPAAPENGGAGGGGVGDEFGAAQPLQRTQSAPNMIHPEDLVPTNVVRNLMMQLYDARPMVRVELSPFKNTRCDRSFVLACRSSTSPATSLSSLPNLSAAPVYIRSNVYELSYDVDGSSAGGSSNPSASGGRGGAVGDGGVGRVGFGFGASKLHASLQWLPTSLRSLSLSGFIPDDTGLLETLGLLTQLQELYLVGMVLGTRGVTQLSRLPQLEHITVDVLTLDPSTRQLSAARTGRESGAARLPRLKSLVVHDVIVWRGGGRGGVMEGGDGGGGDVRGGAVNLASVTPALEFLSLGDMGAGVESRDPLRRQRSRRTNSASRRLFLELGGLHGLTHLRKLEVWDKICLTTELSGCTSLEHLTLHKLIGGRWTQQLGPRCTAAASTSSQAAAAARRALQPPAGVPARPVAPPALPAPQLKHLHLVSCRSICKSRPATLLGMPSGRRVLSNFVPSGPQLATAAAGAAEAAGDVAASHSVAVTVETAAAAVALVGSLPPCCSFDVRVLGCEELTFERCDMSLVLQLLAVALTNPGLVAGLRRLNLVELAALTVGEATIALLARHLPGLQQLRLRRCEGLRESWVMRLATTVGRPGLQVTLVPPASSS